MSKARIMWALLWAVWGGFWSVVAYDIRSWPIEWCIVAMIFLPIMYVAVPNWWARRSGVQTFFVSGCGLTAGMKLWAILSPAMVYPWVTNAWDTALSVLFWGYVGIFIFKLGQTWEAKYNPSFFRESYLRTLAKGRRW